MEIINGSFYFVSDEFFRKVNDSYLKVNYKHTQRPHYLAMKDTKTDLLWLIPCSSKLQKYEKIIAERKARNKPNDTIKVVKVQNNKVVLLLQDMFPIRDTYILNRYIKGGQPVKIANPKVISDIERSAKKVEILLRKGVQFTPTQPDILKIEKIMLDELALEKQQIQQGKIFNAKPHTLLGKALSKALEKVNEVAQNNDTHITSAFAKEEIESNTNKQEVKDIREQNTSPKLTLEERLAQASKKADELNNKSQPENIKTKNNNINLD